MVQTPFVCIWYVHTDFQRGISPSSGVIQCRGSVAGLPSGEKSHLYHQTSRLQRFPGGNGGLRLWLWLWGKGGSQQPVLQRRERDLRVWCLPVSPGPTGPALWVLFGRLQFICWRQLHAGARGPGLQWKRRLCVWTVLVPCKCFWPGVGKVLSVRWLQLSAL